MIRLIMFPFLRLIVELAPGLALCVLAKIAWERPWYDLVVCTI